MRLSAFAEAIDTFSGLRTLAVGEVHNEFVRYTTQDVNDGAADVALEMRNFHSGDHESSLNS